MPKHVVRSRFDHGLWARSLEKTWRGIPAPAQAPSRVDGLKIEVAIQLAHKKVSRRSDETGRQFEHRLELAIDEALRDLGTATPGL